MAAKYMSVSARLKLSAVTGMAFCARAVAGAARTRAHSAILNVIVSSLTRQNDAKRSTHGRLDRSPTGKQADSLFKQPMRGDVRHRPYSLRGPGQARLPLSLRQEGSPPDRKSTRLNSSHMSISYAVFCLLRRPPSSTLFPTRRSSDLPHPPK